MTLTVYCAATYNGTFSVQKKSTKCVHVAALSMPEVLTSQAGDKLWQEIVTTAITNPEEDKL